MHEHNTQPCLLPQTDQFEYDNEYKQTSETAHLKKEKMAKASGKTNFPSELGTRLSWGLEKYFIWHCLLAWIVKAKMEWKHVVGSESRTIKKKWRWSGEPLCTSQALPKQMVDLGSIISPHLLHIVLANCGTLCQGDAGTSPSPVKSVLLTF